MPSKHLKYKYKPSITGKGTIRLKYRDGHLINAKKLPMKLTLIRHGSTSLNDEGRIRGWKDVPLNSKGKEQAKKVGEHLENKGIGQIHTSDLKRAVVTAQIVGNKTGAPVVDKSRAFRPWNVGKYTAKKSSEIHAELADYAQNKPNVPIPGGESFNSFKNRFLNGIKRLEKENPHGRVAVVAHYRNEKLMQAWKKKGYPDDNSIDMKTFLAFNHDKPADVQTFNIK